MDKQVVLANCRPCWILNSCWMGHVWLFCECWPSLQCNFSSTSSCVFALLAVLDIKLFSNTWHEESTLSQEKIAKRFLDRLVAWTKSIKISDPLEEGCRLGSVVSEGQVIQMEIIALIEVWLQTCERFDEDITFKSIIVHDNSDDLQCKKL